MSSADNGKALGRIEGKLEDVLRRLEDQNKRLSSVEKQMYIWQGSLIVVSLVIAMLGSKIAEILGVRIS